MKKEDVSNFKNELTLEKITLKLRSKDVRKSNLNERIAELFGKEFSDARFFNKQNSDIKKEYNKRIHTNSLNMNNSDIMISIFSNSNTSLYEVNRAYTKLSTLSIDEFNNLVSLIDGKKDRFDIFLSHSMRDQYLVFGVYLILTEDLNYKVYVDWITDPFLLETRDKVAIRNIRLLQIRMRQSDTLNLLKTLNYSVSKWIAWEIGYFNRTSDDVFVLNISGKEYDDDKTGMGFIKLYRPTIVKDNTVCYVFNGKCNNII